jgi:hypothetical protein
VGFIPVEVQVLFSAFIFNGLCRYFVFPHIPSKHYSLAYMPHIKGQIFMTYYHKTMIIKKWRYRSSKKLYFTLFSTNSLNVTWENDLRIWCIIQVPKTGFETLTDLFDLSFFRNPYFAYASRRKGLAIC